MAAALMSTLAKEPPVVRFQIVGKSIHVQTTFEHKDLCKGIDGARWNPDLRCWYYPADHYTAQALRESFRGLGRAQADPAFRELLQQVASEPTETPAISPSVFVGPMPTTPLWQHQLTALDKALATPGGYYLAHDMGCIDGDAVVTVNRAGKSFKITMADLHHKFNGGGTPDRWHSGNLRYWKPGISTTIRSLCADGLFHSVRLIATYDRGVQPTLLIRTENGKEIAVTPDHEMVTPIGKIRAEHLSVGDVLLTNGRYIDKDGYVRLWKTGHPREGTGGVYEHIIVAEQMIGRPLRDDEEVHHRNEIKHDNRPENLQVLASLEHRQIHANVVALDGGVGRFIPIESAILSIEDGGERHVYDLTVNEAAHTFVANGIVVGNSGKTLTAIAAMLRMECQKILIVCPKRVITTWRDQFERHAPGQIIALPLVKGNTQKKVATAIEWMRSYEPLAIIMNYETVIQPDMKAWLLKQKWDIIVLDEAHRIKSPGGKQSKSLATIGRRASYRLCMSGTPFPHGPLDIYAQFRFLAPDVFGTNYNQFKATYAITNPNMHDQVIEYINQDDLNQKFYSIADRVMTRDVMELPEERDEILYGDLSEKARKHYIDLETLFWTELENMPDEPSEVSISNVLTRILRLQQITSGYVRDDDRVDRLLDTTKADLLSDLVEDFPDDEPLVLFAKFSHDLDTIRRVMVQKGRSYGELSGRHDDYAAWSAGNINTIGIQLQAGGEGLNDLVRARYCVYFSVDHSLKNYNQSRARIMRPGQKQNCVYYHLICKDTIDEAVYRALSSRQEIVSALLKERKGHSTPAQDAIAEYVGDEMRHF